MATRVSGFRPTITGTAPLRRWLGATAVAAILVLAATGATVRPVRAADGLTMQAHALLQGHVRTGAWMAIVADFTNDGPGVQGELQLAGGTQGQTRFSVLVDLPTGSRQSYVLYAQPPAFGRSVKVQLVSGDAVVASADVAFLSHDPQQLIVGIVAERPEGIVGELHLDPSISGSAAAIVTLSVADLPGRVEGWATLDRVIWQDVDSNALSLDQLAALRSWVAAGGRLVIAAGSAGLGTLSGFPDDLLPYRPDATIAIAPSAISGLIGTPPADAGDIPALAGAPGSGQSIATSGDRVVAASVDDGSGRVTLLGFDPTTSWLAAGHGVESLWRQLLPNRVGGGPVIASDDSQIVSAVGQLASLALPPVGGLIVILGGYILLIGPLNYLVLRRLDRRELAWITMPALIVAFAVGAYGFGTALRGNDVIVNEVAVVRGAPDTSEAMAQVYLGIFSPTRSTYQVEVPGGALLAAPISGDLGFNGTATSLDVLQGDPAVARNLAVGFGSLRTIRAESAATAPRIRTDLTFTDGALAGTVTNASDQTLEQVAVVLGSAVDVVQDIGPGESKPVSLHPAGNAQFQTLSDRIFGQVFFGDASQATDDGLRQRARHAVVDQLTYDPNFGTGFTLNAPGPVVLAWGRQDVLDVRIQGQAVRRNSNVLYYYPVGLHVTGQTTFTDDLLHTTVVATDAGFFSKDPFSLNMGPGTATIAYAPIAFEGTMAATDLQLALNFQGATFPSSSAKLVVPLESNPVACTGGSNAEPPGCTPPRFDGLPDIDLFDRSDGGTWVRLPSLGGTTAYSVEHPERFVDPATGQVLVRFVNQSQNGGVGFQFQLALTGVVQ